MIAGKKHGLSLCRGGSKSVRFLRLFWKRKKSVIGLIFIDVNRLNAIF